jgi:hypothetical protein
MNATEQLSTRELEIAQLEIAIAKTEAAQRRAQDTMYALAEKRGRQTAELLFQKLMARADKRNCSNAGTERRRAAAKEAGIEG